MFIYVTQMFTFELESQLGFGFEWGDWGRLGGHLGMRRCVDGCVDGCRRRDGGEAVHARSFKERCLSPAVSTGSINERLDGFCKLSLQRYKALKFLWALGLMQKPLSPTSPCQY